MHLQLNLSNQLAKQWKTPLSDAPPETQLNRLAGLLVETIEGFLSVN